MVAIRTNSHYYSEYGRDDLLSLLSAANAARVTWVLTSQPKSTVSPLPAIEP